MASPEGLPHFLDAEMASPEGLPHFLDAEMTSPEGGIHFPALSGWMSTPSRVRALRLSV